MTPETGTVLSVEESAVSIVEQAQSVRVTNQETLEQANDILGAIKKMHKEVVAEFDPKVKAAHAAHKAAVAHMKKYTTPLEAAEKAIKCDMQRYVTEQEEKESKERERAQREAEEKERKRIADLEAKEQKARESGDEAKAEKLAAKKEDVSYAPKTVAPKVNKVDGLSFKEVWTADVTDMRALIKAVADGIAPIAILEVNKSNLSRHAKLVQNTQDIPGVKIYCKKEIAKRTSK